MIVFFPFYRDLKMAYHRGSSLSRLLLFSTAMAVLLHPHIVPTTWAQETRRAAPLRRLKALTDRDLDQHNIANIFASRKYVCCSVVMVYCSSGSQ